MYMYMSTLKVETTRIFKFYIMKIYAVSMATISNYAHAHVLHYACINLFCMTGAIVCFNDSPKVLLSP